jgi:hypothetical protein
MATPRIFETLAIRLRAHRIHLVLIAAASLSFLLLGIFLTAAGLMSLNIAHRFLPGCMAVLMFGTGLFLVQAWFHGTSIQRRAWYWLAALFLDAWLLVATFMLGLGLRA